MMSFSQEVKNELVAIEYERFCCKKALLYGMCLFGKSFSGRLVSLQTENREIGRLYCSLLYTVCHVQAVLTVSPKGRNYTAAVQEPGACMKVLKTFSHGTVGSLKINHSNFDCEACARAFIAGAFLACGTVSTPQKDYHLEFTVPYQNLAQSFLTMLMESELSPKLTNRKGYHIIYFKESESIEDCLYLMGASDAMYEMMHIEIVKDIRNKANRQANCETANIERMVRAVSTQLCAIEKIRKTKGMDYLTEDLQSMANLRLENPDASLQELSALSGLSRSGVNHRLNRIVKLSEEL